MRHSIHHAQPGLRIVARQDDDFDGRLFGENAVEVQQALDERKGAAGLGDVIPVGSLIALECSDAFFFVDFVFKREIELRRGGDTDDELLFDREGHRFDSPRWVAA
jgi:hypothetical protein